MKNFENIETIKTEDIEIIESQEDLTEGEVIEVEEFIENGVVHRKKFLERIIDKINNYFK